MSFKVFLSYSSKDNNIANYIHSNAKLLGIDVLLAEKHFTPGVQLSQKVAYLISTSDCTIVLLTPNSQRSTYVQQEIGLSKAYNKLIIPIICPGFDETSLAVLEGVEYVKWDQNNPQYAVQALMKYLYELKNNDERSKLFAIVIGIIILLALHENNQYVY